MVDVVDTTLAPGNLPVTNSTSSSQILSDDLLLQMNQGISVLMSFFILLGIFSNITNIVVFWRMGFSAISNINLAALSVTDLMTLIFLTVVLCGNNGFFTLETFVSAKDMSLLIAPLFYTSLAFSSWITAIINMERCCCIMLPMKVRKSLFIYLCHEKLLGIVATIIAPPEGKIVV